VFAITKLRFIFLLRKAVKVNNKVGKHMPEGFPNHPIAEAVSHTAFRTREQYHASFAHRQTRNLANLQISAV
jgi:hypothetical protein